MKSSGSGPRIAVFGAGGVGGYFAARLAAAGRDVTVIARGAHLEAIRSGGLRLDSVAGDITARPAATDDPGSVGVVDLVILGVKTWQIEGVAESIGPMVGSTTVVLPTQNGVETADRLAARFGDAPVLGGIARIISFVSEPGVIRHVGGPGLIEIGERDGRPSDRVSAIRDLLDVPGIKAVVSADIRVALWEKMLFVVPFGGVGAVTRAPIGVTRSLPRTRTMLDDAMREIQAVAAGRGIRITDAARERAWSFLDSLPAEGTASLQRDIAAGVPSELDDWCGAIDRIGGECGVPTPVHSFIYSSLLPQESSARDRSSDGG